MGIQRDHATVRGIRVFADALAAEKVADVFGYVDPWGVRVVMGEFVGVELIERVDANDLDSREGIKRLGRERGVHLLFGFFGARIAVAERISDGWTVGLETDVVDGPAVDRDGSDAFGGLLRCQFDASFDACKDFLSVPA